MLQFTPGPSMLAIVEVANIYWGLTTSDHTKSFQLEEAAPVTEVQRGEAISPSPATSRW